MLNPELTEPVPGVSDELEKEHLALFGRPEHARLTAQLKLPPRALTVTVELAVLPAVTLALEGEAEMAKSTPVPLSEVDCGLPLDASSLTVSVPVRVPVILGVNVTLTVQLAPGAKVEEQLFV